MNYTNKNRKGIAIFLLLTILFQICLPLRTFALTGGPSQPEVQSFEPVGTTDMVDLFTGDFNYNIPLLDVEGYPINISYHSGIGMDQEASWVGLGWNINPGVINRGMRGLPDDFNGDLIRQKYDSKPHENRGVLGSFAFEILGKEKEKKPSDTAYGAQTLIKALGSNGKTNVIQNATITNKTNRNSMPISVSFGIKYDTYRGMGISFGISPSMQIKKSTTTNNIDFAMDRTPLEYLYKTGGKITGGKTNSMKISDNKTQKFGLDLNFDSQDGFSSTANYTQSTINGEAVSKSGAPTNSFSVGAGYSSRSGFTCLTGSWFKGASYYNNGTHKGKTKENLVTSGNNNGGAILTQNHPSYQPSAAQPVNTWAIAGNFKIGGEIWGINPELDLRGYYTWQHYKNTDITKNAYGCLYDMNSGKDGFVKDFNRFNLSSFSAKTQDLPLSSLTYDYYNVNGQGIGGSYRAKQSYIPIVYDDEVRSYSTNLSAGGEVGLPAISKWGLNASVVFTSKRDGVKGLSANESKFIAMSDNDVKPYDFENTYFKYVGERTPIDMDQYRVIGAKNALDPNSFLDSIKIANDYKWKLFNSKDGMHKPIRNEREKRNQVFQYLTVRQCLVNGAALDKKIKSYPLNSIEHLFPSESTSGIVEISRLKEPLDQISEVTVLSDDGRRYIYGIPAMNIKQVEYTFSVSKDDAVNNGIVTYPTSGSSINYHNTDGYSNINYSYQEQEMPRYAHSYLLTGVLSDDYVDIEQDGITPDDYGSAIKFNYTQVKSNYHWRTPYNQKKANYQPGFKSNNNDNKANFVYGEKEMWYMHSIESKNMVAVFILSKRADGLGVTDFNGGQNSADTVMKLDKIILYARTDLKLHGASAVPIKTVFFEYDYSRCPNVENNSGATITVNSVNINANKGKLTLKKIYFTYGNSNKGKYTSYRFSYTSSNPDYNIKAYDRWGNYSPFVNGDATTCDNSQYPFVNQNKSSAATYASAWSLNKIELPTGGVINITYESDDYAYVQNKKAMQMFKIKGFGQNNTDYNSSNPKNTLYDNDYNNNNYVFIEIPNLTSDKLNRSLKGLDKIYYNLNSLIRRYNGNEPREDIFGFCNLELNSDNSPVCGVYGGNIAWIKVKEVSIKDADEKDSRTKIQPMAKNAFIFSIQNLPEQVYPGSAPNGTGESAWKGLATSMGEFVKIFKTFYRIMRDKKYCQEVELGKSYIRLNNPDGFKMGGGCRVKKLELDDKWKDMENTTTNVSSSSYGQEYDYRTVDEISGDTISSGVASWEPSIGGEENPFRMPNYEIHKRYTTRDEVITHLDPVAEAFYPTPSVGYSKVTVKSLGGTTGRTVTDFYTAKDFPTCFYRTDLKKSTTDQWGIELGKEAAKIGTTAAMNALSTKKLGLGLDLNYDKLVAKQGYAIVNNDMHGKIHKQTVYPEGTNNPKSWVEYVYQTIKEPEPSNGEMGWHLDNHVLVYDYKDNTVKTKEVALDYDMTYDKQAEETITASATFKYNVDLFVIPPTPVPATTFYLGMGFQLSDFRYSVITKVVNQYGILKTIRAYEDGSNIETNNLMYDAHTGEVLLTETQNEFNDKIYNLNYPAHFAYDRMGQAYRNINIELTDVLVNDLGKLSQDGITDNISKSLVLGDEVIIVGKSDEANLNQKAWVHKLKSTPDLCFIDKDGAILKNARLTSVKVIRSGRRNMQNIPIGGIVSLKNPLVYSGGNYSLAIDAAYVLNASAQIFSDEWLTMCGYENKHICKTETSAGTAFKRWLFRLAYNDKFKESINYSGDEIVPAIFKAMPFCDGDPATNYTATSTECSSVTYQFKDGTENCCSFTLSNDNYNKGLSHQVTRYYIMLNTNDTDFMTDDGHLVDAHIWDADTIRAKIKFGHDARTFTGGSWVYNQYFDNDSTVGANHHLLYKVSQSLYNNTSLFYGGSSNVLKKYMSLEDTTEYYCVSYHETNAAGTNIVSVDTLSFRNQSGASLDWDKKIRILATLSNGDKVWLSGSFGEGCGPVLFEDCCQPDCLPPESRAVNPYLANVRGTWRKKADYAYHDKRVQTESSGVHSPKLRNDGVFNDFKPFWSFNTNKYAQTSNTEWKRASEVTVYNPYGNEMEDKNALGIYSSALFGYNNRLPIAVANNAKYTQIAYDGFEDYGMLYGYSTCPFTHWNFEFSLTTSIVDTNVAHTGRNSLRVPVNDSAIVSRKVFDCSNVYKGVETEQFVIDACDCIKKFSPDSGDYLIGAWVKEDHTTNQPMISNYNDACIKIKLHKKCGDADSLIYTFKGSGPVIEEWQRIEGKFRIPAGYEVVEVHLYAPTQRAWFDDIRIQPYLGNMKTFAYNQSNLRLMAEMDENNFATFYEYDLEGQLMRVKKETSRGIVTLKEVRSNSSNK